MDTNWTKFGWQGIAVEIPEDWEMSGLSGDFSSGYLRLDDAQMPRLEIKWSKAMRKKPDLHKVLDEYFQLVRKNYKKKMESLFIKRDVNLIRDKSFFEGRDVVFFNWKSDVRANGAIWHCHECKRIVIKQILGHPKGSMREDTLRILTSAIDHSPGHTNLWSAYQLSVSIPRRYKLDKQKLMSGYLLLSFADGSRKIAVERYGLADVLLKSVDLETWLRNTYKKAFIGYGFSIEKEDTQIDENIMITGSKSRLTDKIPFSPVLLLDKIARRNRLSAQIWRCRQSNRIFAVRVIAKVDAPKTAGEVVESIQCH